MSNPITLRNPELWRRIESFQIDDGTPSLTFAARLARENGWSVSFAERVVEEYKRFVYLAMTAGHRVTPSEHVDQAWHLHMLYTESYWDRLCGEVLPRALEHAPTKGGGSEDAKFDDWYARTKVAYEREFGAMPPRDVWPESEVRFGHDLQWRRVNTADCWVVPKRAGRTLVSVLGMIFVGVIMLALVLTPTVHPNVKTIAVIVGAIMIVVLLVLGATWSAIAVRSQARGRGTTDGGCGGCGGGGCGGGGD